MVSVTRWNNTTFAHEPCAMKLNITAATNAIQPISLPDVRKTTLSQS